VKSIGYLKIEENYSGSYGAVRDYLRFRSSTTSNHIVWEHLYEQILSLSKKDAIKLLQSLSFNALPLISARL